MDRLEHVPQQIAEHPVRRTPELTPIPDSSGTDPAWQRYFQQWKATRLIDERTGNSCIGIDFPRRQPGRGFEVFDDDLAEQPKKIRALLKSQGAAFIGTKDRQIRLIQRLLKEMAPEPVTLAMKPGLRGPDGFVLGKCMVGTAVGKLRWKSGSVADAQGQIGDCQGSKGNWDQDVGAVAFAFHLFDIRLVAIARLPAAQLRSSPG